MRLLTMGEALAVFDPLQPGPLGSVDSFRRHAGGAEVNVAVGLARLGCKVRWFGRLGEDPFGYDLYRLLRGEGVEVEHVEFDPQAPTGLYIKERRTPDKINSYYYRAYSAASLLKPELLPDDILEGIDYLHLTGITPALSSGCLDATFVLAKNARKKGIKISFDPNLRLKLWDLPKAKEVLTKIAALSDLILPGLEEGRLLWGEEIDWDESWQSQEAATYLGKYLLSLGAEQVVIKLGKDGAMLVDKKGSSFFPAFNVKTVDVVGAGDGFAAGLLSGLLQNKPIAEAIEDAQAVAAFVVSSPGDLEGLPTQRELEMFLGREQGVER